MHPLDHIRAYANEGTQNGQGPSQKDQPCDQRFGTLSHVIPGQPLRKGGRLKTVITLTANDSINCAYVMNPPEEPTRRGLGEFLGWGSGTLPRASEPDPKLQEDRVPLYVNSPYVSLYLVIFFKILYNKLMIK